MPVRDSHNDNPGGGPDRRSDKGPDKGPGTRADRRSDDRFKPAMPRIPGVSDQPTKLQPAQPVEWSNEPPSEENAPQDRSPSARLVIMIGLAVGFACVLGWWTLRAKPAPAKPVDSADPVIEAPPAPSDDAAGSAQDANSGVTSVATLGELAKPWSAKKFTFVNPQTQERVPAMIVRLPGANAASKDAYWAFSLNAPYKTCQLDYLENLADIVTRYGFRATHPMVVAGCDATLYDPLRMGTTPDGAWVRGDIAQGPGIRPPISIEIRVQGGRIVADRIE